MAQLVPTRNEMRKSWPMPTRMTLLEGDVDTIEREGDERMTRVESKLDRVYYSFVGLMASLVVASIIMAANLALK